MLLHDLTLPTSDFEAGTGWSIRPEGACRGETCIPLRGDPSGATGDSVDVRSIASQIGLQLVRHDDDLWALGPWPGTGHALTSAHAPELVLPDVHGEEFRLSSLRGQKVLILSWAPY